MCVWVCTWSDLSEADVTRVVCRLLVAGLERKRTGVPCGRSGRPTAYARGDANNPFAKGPRTCRSAVCTQCEANANPIAKGPRSRIGAVFHGPPARRSRPGCRLHPRRTWASTRAGRPTTYSVSPRRSAGGGRATPAGLAQGVWWAVSCGQAALVCTAARADCEGPQGARVRQANWQANRQRKDGPLRCCRATAATDR